MALYRKKGCMVWYYHCSINGKKWERSTGEVDRDRALFQVPHLEKMAQLYRKRSGDCLRLKSAITAEVARLEADVSTRQAERVSYALANFFTWLGKDALLDRIDTQLLENYQRHRIEKASKETVDKELSYVVRLLRTNGLRIDKPRSKPGRIAELRPFTKEELKRFFSFCPNEWRTAFLTMLITGARPAEIIPSKRSDHVAILKEELDSKSGTLTIRSAKVQKRLGKKGTVRTVKIPKELVQMLEEQAKLTDAPHIFSSYQPLHRIFNRILSKAKIPKEDVLGRKLTSHSFRHTYASMLAEACSGNAFALKAALGHSQISTTDRYVHSVAPAMVVDMSFLELQSTESRPGGNSLVENQPQSAT